MKGTPGLLINLYVFALPQEIQPDRLVRCMTVKGGAKLTFLRSTGILNIFALKYLPSGTSHLSWLRYKAKDSTHEGETHFVSPAALCHPTPLLFLSLVSIGLAFLQKKEHGDMASRRQNLKGPGKEENNDCFF